MAEHDTEVPANGKAPSALSVAVTYWRERLFGEADPQAQSGDPPGRRARLAELLEPVVRVLYPGAKAKAPEACPLSDRQSVRKTLSALDAIVGADPVHTNELLLRIVEHGEKRLGWRLPEAIDTVLRLPRELPLLTPQEVVGLTGLARLEEALAQSFLFPERLDARARAGQVLYSAIVHGGLLRTDLQRGLLSCRRDALSITPHGTWLALPIDIEAADAARERLHERWLVRPETELVLLRYWQDGVGAGSFPTAKPWTLIKAYLAAAGVPRKRQPLSLAALNRWARARHALTLPPFLRETATGRFRSQGLGDIAHRRFCTGEALWQPSPAAPKSHPRPSQIAARPPDPGGGTTLSEANRCLGELFRPLSDEKSSRAEKRERLARGLEAESVRLGRIGWLIGQWCVHLLREGRRPLRLSSVLRYVRPVKRYVLPRFDGVNPAALSDEEWEGRIQEAMDLANDRLAPAAIYWFAQFLVAQPEGPGFDSDDLEGAEAVAGYNANLVSVADFEAAMGRLLAGSDRDTEMAWLVGALGFYAGLRRGEALHIRMGDISGAHAPWHFVRGNSQHTLKRYASQRALPLYALLPRHWLRRLQVWVARREAEGRASSKDRLLFCLAGQESTPPRGEDLITPIRDALRAVTWDHTLVFHHLRHSFANWTLIRLLAPELPLADWQRRFAALRSDWFSQPAQAALRRAVLGAGVRCEPVRHAAYALARLMGHAEVATTLRHYVHLADLLAFGYETHGRALVLDEDSVRALLGLGVPNEPRDARYHRWRRWRKEAWDETIGGLRPETVLERARTDTLGYDEGWPAPRSAGADAVPIAEPPPVPRDLQLADMPMLLNALRGDRSCVDEVAERLNVPAEQVQRAKDAAQRLSEATTKRKHDPRFVLPPRPPSGEADGDAWKRALQHLAVNPFDRVTVGGGIGLLLRADPGRGHRVILWRDEEALGFAGMLGALGFARSRLRLDLYPQRGQEAANRAHWEKLLGLKPEQIVVKPFKRVGPSAVNGEIALDVPGVRRYSRLGALDRPPKAYDPRQAKRGLVWLFAEFDGPGWAWRLPDAKAVDDLTALLGWFGVPPERIIADAGALRLEVSGDAGLDPQTVARGAQALAGAKAHHDLRVVGGEEEIVAAAKVLSAWGVGQQRLRFEFAGRWDQQVREESVSRLAGCLQLKPEQIEAKSRQDKDPTLSLTVPMDRGGQPVKSWSLTDTLIMVYVLYESLPAAAGP
jgi:integrase